MGSTRVHVDAPASETAFGTASAGAFMPGSQTGQARGQRGRQARRQADSRNCAKCLAPAVPSSR